MTKLKRVILAVAMAVAVLFQTALHAGLITGNLGITGQVTLDTGSAGTATEVTSWIISACNGASGTFANEPYAIPNNTPVAFEGQSWRFNSTLPTTNFLNVDGFKFELLSSFVFYQTNTPPYSGFAIVNGWGVLSGNGFTPTMCFWDFSISNPPGSQNGVTFWTFRASIDCVNTNGEPLLASTTISNTTVLSWSDPTFGLQSAPAANGLFTNIPGATSPYTNAIAGTQQFFRLMQP